jgi:PAS domain S-box-containing protein
VSDGERLVGSVQLCVAWFDELGRPSGAPRVVPGILSTLSASPEYRMFVRNLPERIDRYRDDRHVSSTDLEEGLMPRLPSTMVAALKNSSGEGLWEARDIGTTLWDLYCVRERDGEETIGYLTFGLRRHGLGHGLWLFARSALVALVLAAFALVLLASLGRVVPRRTTGARLQLPRFGFRERVIGGFLLVSLVPTVFLGVLGRNLVVQQKQQQFRTGLEEDLRVARELIGRRLVDAARNAAASDEIRTVLAGRAAPTTLSAPASVDGLIVSSESGKVLAQTRSADAHLAELCATVDVGASPVEFFHRPLEGERLVACAVVPITSGAEPARWRVLAFERIDARLAADLERRVGSPLSFFAGGRLTSTSKPELYRSEILSDLVDPRAYVRIELEGAQRVFQATRTGATSLLAGYAPLRDEEGRPAGVVSALAPHPEGLDPDASAVLSRIYFLCLFVIAAAISGAMLLANRLTRPISELTEGAEKIRAGRLGTRIASRATGEIGRLIRSFNLMSVQLAESEVRDRERREYIEAIIRHVGSGVVSFDASGRVATVNEAAARILSANAEELQGMSVTDPRGAAPVHAVCGAVRPLLEGAGREIVQELEVPDPRDASAEPRMLRLVATPLVDREGRPQGAVAVFEDLTDLVRSKKITAWAQMARQVAHEIKNPLTPMKLSAQHLRQAWRDKHPKFERILEESTETIVDRCEALRRIAIEFSDYARMPGRRVRREDLGRLLREAHRLYGEADGRGVEFRLDTPDGELYSRVDRDEVMRLFINLIENSIQAMPDGGDLEVRAARENGAACVTIKDSGVGIPTENLPRIFEPSFSTKTGGAGLGLPICKAIMEDYGGSISIASVAGEGTTVTLMFPVDETRSTAAES